MSGKRERGITYGPTAKLNLVNDAVAGGASNFGTGASLYGGQLGIEFELTDNQVQYDATTGTLYGGRYQYVQTLSAGTAAPARGLAAFWSTPNSWVVTADATNGEYAGVFLNTVTKGNFCYIQKSGLGTCKFATGQTPAAKLIVAQTSAANTFDSLADGVSLTTTNFKLIVGRAKGAADASNYGVVELNPGNMDTPF